MQIFIPMWAMWCFVLSGMTILAVLVTVILYAIYVCWKHKIGFKDLYINIQRIYFQIRR